MVNSNSGYLLNNRYRLIDQIGEGGMANVYLGKDTILNRNVAIKVLRGDLSHDETFVRRFQREALAATALEHPNLVQVYDVGEEQGYHYIVMEYIEGKTLKQLIKQHGPLSIGETIDVMEQLVSAVEHAHSRQVIHRDIKPQNVIVRNDGTVKLTDFGIAIAQNAAQLTQTNSIMGSVHYLAPELAKGQPATVQSDIYSLGILMFELLSGQVPFAGESAVNIALMHMEDKIPSIKQIVGPDVNQAIENIILKATAKNRNYRYHSAHEMLLDLVDCQYRNDEVAYELEDDNVEDGYDGGDTTIIMDRDELNKKKKKKLSRRAKIIIAAVVAALLALGIVGFFILNNDSTDISMPDIVNVSKAEAEKALNEAGITKEKGFTINYEDEQSEEIAEGNVVKTDPVKDIKLKKKQTVTVYISTGYEVEVPDVTGKYLDEAKAELEAAGFKVSEVSEESSEAEYKVLSQTPAGGQKVEKGSTITVKYAVKEKITMINVIGLTYLNAYDRLQALGYIVSSSNCGESDTVSKQSVSAGTTSDKGKKVKLTCEIKNDAETPPSDSTTGDATAE